MINTIAQNQISQQKHKTKKKKASFDYVSARKLSDSRKKLESLRGKSLAAANFLIKLAKEKVGHKFSRRAIGNIFGISEATVKRIIKILCDIGFIRSINKYLRPNSFIIGPSVFVGYIRQSFIHLLPALGLLLNIAFLLSQPNDPHNNIGIYPEKSAQFKTVKKQFSGEYNTFTRNYREYLQPMIEHLSDNAPKKGTSMSAESTLFRPVLGSLSSLELTPHGKAELEAYPDQAILAGDARLAKSLKAGAAVSSPLGYLISGAKAWCKENNIQPNFARTSYLIRELSIETESVKFSAIKLSKEEPKAQSTARASTTAWKAQLDKDRASYDAEQAELPNLTREERKCRIAPALESYKKCSPEMRRVLIKLHPFPDAQELIDELLNPAKLTERIWTQEEIDTWAPLIGSMGAFTQEQRAQAMKANDMAQYIPLVEKLIKERPLTLIDETVWEEV